LVVALLLSYEDVLLLFPGKDRLEGAVKKIDIFRTSLSGIHGIPDPLNLFTLNQWYVLDAVSENLIRFNHIGGFYEPVLAESWTSNANGFRFRLRKNLKFHDGSDLSLEDVLASFQRIIRVRSSTHYQIWHYLNDCEPNSCDSIRIEGDELVVDFTKGDPATFFMFLSSPEGAVWSKQDVEGLQFKPRRFSGFYFPQESDGFIRLKANPYSIRKPNFPNAPSDVQIFDLPRSESLAAVKNNKLDAVMLDYTPFSSQLSDAEGLTIQKTLPVAFIYLMRVNKNSATPFNSSFLRELHGSIEPSGLLSPAYGLLPPGVEGQLDSESLNKVIDIGTEKRPVRIGFLPTYHSHEFVDQVRRSCSSSGIEASFESLSRDRFYAVISAAPVANDIDYLLVGYMASDKFPLTQLKLILSDMEMPFDFDRADLSGTALIEYLRSIQKHAIEKQMIVPFYYAPVLRVSRPDVDLGNQPSTDGELQFWRLNESIVNSHR
jgi:hypothetical protein